MIALLKKYRLNIIVLLVLTGLLFFFIPNEESRYLQPDMEEIKSKSHSVVLWTLIILFGLLFLFGVRQIKKFTELFFLVVGLGLMSLTVFFLFDAIFLSSTLFLNKLSKDKTVDKKYNVVYIDSSRKTLLLWDDNVKKSVRADELLRFDKDKIINVTDTVIVSFTKGLLGFNFDPTIKEIRNTAANKGIAISGAGS